MCRMHGTITHSSVCSSTHASARVPPGEATAPASHPGAGWRAGEGFEQGFFLGGGSVLFWGFEAPGGFLKGLRGLR